jgi:outer membrane biosynthesis protein TonB
MIPRLLVPFGSKPPSADTPTTRRRPSSLDERTLVPAMLPIVHLDGRTNIPSSLPLESIATRVVVPRDLNRGALDVHEEPSSLPLQPTDLDERITVPQGSAAPVIVERTESLPPVDIVDPDIFTTGEVNLLAKPPKEDKWDLVTRIGSIAFHILLIAAIILQPKLFPRRPPTEAEMDLARRQITILLPPGALDAPKNIPRPKEPTVHVDPRVIRRVAPPEPKPTPVPKEPERVAKDLPAAPVPQPNTTAPPQSKDVAKAETPKQPLKLEAPEQQPTEHALLLPKTSLGSSLQDSIRESAKMNAPSAVTGGGRIPNTRGVPGGGGQGAAYGAIDLLTPTNGVDFNDYLHRVYLTVKQNWFAVMPESVSLGDKGVVSLQFRIMKNGSVPAGEPVRVLASGKEPLDRAAISSIRTSNPFEPLPSAFTGDFIELRFTYYYNLQPDYSH